MPKILCKLSKNILLEKTPLKKFGLIKNRLREKPKAAVAERAIRSVKHIINYYIEDHAEQFIHKLPQFVSTMNCRINGFLGKSPRDVMNTDFLSILYNRQY